METPEVIPPPQQRTHLSLGKMLLLLMAFIGIITIVYFLYLQFFRRSPIPMGKLLIEDRSIKYKQFINCDDVRDVIDEENTLYIACLGGVLIIDPQGNVKDQITMTNGLSNATTTSLEKRGNTLYIGTQDGFTIFDLKTRSAKKISVAEGLVSGSNIELALDGNTLWIGTFKGLNSYDIATGEIKSFTTELVDNSTDYGADELLVTPKALYVIIRANAYTPGGVARFDKQTRTWKRWGPPAFLEKVDQYSRMDLSYMVNNNDKIYVAQDMSVWEGGDAEDGTWKKLDLGNLAKGNTYLYGLAPYKDGIATIINGKLYSVEHESNKVTLLYPQGANKSILSNSGILPGTFIRENKIWVSSSGTASKDIPWLAWLDIDTLETGTLSIKNRPTDFEKIAAIIDNTVLLYGGGAIYSFNPSTGAFKKLFDHVITVNLEVGGQINFDPLPQTPLISLFNQSCGQGCSEPEFALFDYQTQQTKSYKLPENLQKLIKNEISVGPNSTFTNYSDIRYDGYDESTKELLFAFSTAEKDISAQYSPDEDSWKSVIKDRPKDPGIPNPVTQTVYCNPVYTFASNGNKFSKKECSDLLENSIYSWTIEGNKVYEVNKPSGKKTELKYPVTPPQYSPFPDWNHEPTIYQALFKNNKLWLGTSRGIAIYSLKNRTWKLLSTNNGLISNEIESFVVGENDLFVISHWGGFSQIPH